MAALSASEHCRVVLSAIIPDRRDLLDKALRHLSPAHFPDPTLRNVFVMTERYCDVTGAVMTRGALSDIISKGGADAGRVMLYEETYDALAEAHPTEADFRWSLEQVRDLAAEQATSSALTSSLDVLHRGVKDTKGREWRGHADARTFVLTALGEIERDLSMQDAPEGDTRVEGEPMMADYADRKQARLTGRNQGVMFGIADLDTKIGGLQPGELDLVVAYAGEGKTTLSVQTAWHAATQQGLNSVIMTTETLRPQVRRKLIARHSMLEQFELPDGLDTRMLKTGSLPDHLERKLQEVVDDYTHNPAYGHIYVAQVPRMGTIEVIESKLFRISRMWHVDLCVIDYLALLASERRRSDGRQELSDVVKAAKVLAATFDDGNGVAVLSPWQVNRTSYEEALKSGYYTLKALSDTAESEKSSDVIVSLLGSPENESRHAELRAQILKNRDGEKASSLILDVDYATCVVAEKRRSTAMSELLDE